MTPQAASETDKTSSRWPSQTPTIGLLPRPFPGSAVLLRYTLHPAKQRYSGEFSRTERASPIPVLSRHPR
jgi:hypothetical protein